MSPIPFAQTVKELRLRADACRELADRILDPGTAGELRELADALDAQADGLAETAPGSTD